MASQSQSVERHKPQLVWKCDSKGKKKGQVNLPIGVAFMSDGNIIIADYSNHRLQVFDVNTGHSLHTFGDGQIELYDVTVDDENIYATDYKNKCVQVYTTTGVHKHSWGKGKYSYPYGITCLRNGNIAVIDYSNNTVTIHDNSTGEILTCFGQSAHLSKPLFITEDSNGRIIISDYNSGSITIFDPAGNMLQKITETETGKKITDPRGVCVDSNDNILLAMRTDHSVVKFDCSGRFLGEVLTREDGLGQPTGIAVSPAGDLALCENNLKNALKLFTYK